MAALTGAVEAEWVTLKMRDFVLRHKEQLVVEVRVVLGRGPALRVGFLGCNYVHLSVCVGE